MPVSIHSAGHHRHIHLSLAQAVPVDGAVIVTTPQDIAVADARKCLTTFTKLGVPVLGRLTMSVGMLLE